ncbi:uncharacterized protein BO88DRAFT_72428 [Aspergillus vadensis CBS 113365]|uniref:Uncharacterized protein n=1 Tax=Aspergillus vadensis (strain CBS 113365 / IMI 142717 / IBT 24658) TaxID=1448311 RepID=A0A319BBE8_ASPVC|nr:hypothetical protein BO88DRAFT_72428 [Aspergillus vadensis CBS 113365]PYH67920.1 hypothetical protein BO88DRAFT_72428 [Aspergillus vadensis CBS 113365]
MSKPPQYDGFSCLPTELFETLLSYLDVDTIKALRLTCNKLAKRCIGPRFLVFIHQPLLDVTSENLRSLLALARNPDLRKKVHSITLLATIMDISGLEQNVKDGYYTVIMVDGPRWRRVEVDYSPEELSNAKDDLIRLVEQKEARKNETPSELVKLLEHVLQTFGELDAIHLDGAVVRGRKERRSIESGEWMPLWTRAAQVFSWVTRALVQSQASVKRFDIYQSNRKCGIEAANIGNRSLTHDPAELGMPIKGLQSLEMSLSGDVQDALDYRERREDTKEAEEKMARITKEQDSYGTPRLPSFFLKSTPSLRKLELSFRQTATLGSKSFRHKYDWIIHSIAHEAQFPLLEECTLAGFSARSDSILVLFRKTPGIRSLKIHECHLSSGSWTPIFAHLEASMPELQTLDLSNLWGKHMQNMNHAQAHEGDGNDNSRQEEEDDWQEGDGLVIWHTNPRPLRTRYTSTTGSGVHTICFTREEIKKGLVSRPLNPGPGRVKGSAENWRWRKNRLTLYGPLS